MSLASLTMDMTDDQLLEHTKTVFGFYGNASANQQGNRVDDAISQFDAVLNELKKRLAK